MSAQLRQCRQGLAKALGQAMSHLPEVTYCSGPGPVLQGSRHEQEDSTVSGPEPEHQDLPARISSVALHSSCCASEESLSMETLDELMAKLEFENELNRVCHRFSLNLNTAPERYSTGSTDSGVEEGAADGEDDEEEARLMETVLDMEQDYEIFVY